MKRKVLITAVCLLILPMLFIRLYYAFIPRGASLEPFAGYSRELAPVTSPTGKTYRVFVNDAGAMHSGNHWLWVVDHNWIMGRKVVLEGYVTPKYATGQAELEVTWERDRPVIEFASSR